MSTTLIENTEHHAPSHRCHSDGERLGPAVPSCFAPLPPAHSIIAEVSGQDGDESCLREGTLHGSDHAEVDGDTRLKV